MENKLRELRILRRKRNKSYPAEDMCCVRLGPLEKTQSKSLEKEDEDTLTEDLDTATAAMMAMFGNVGLDSECSSARSSVKSKYSIQAETDSDDDEPDQFEETLCPYFPGNRRFSMVVGQNNESRYNLCVLLGRLTHHKRVTTNANPMNDRLSVLNPAGRILRKFQGSLDKAVELATGLPDDDPAKMELVATLHQHLCLLKEEVKDNMKQTLLFSAIAEEFEEQSEQGSNGGKNEM